MREIKFRAWDSDTKCGVMAWIAENALMPQEGLPTTIIIQQYTGLKDKNGKEIYEGDKVRWSTWDGYTGEATVEFRNGYFYPVAEGCLDYQRFDKEQGFEVIGNIYEGMNYADK